MSHHTNASTDLDRDPWFIPLRVDASRVLTPAQIRGCNEAGHLWRTRADWSAQRGQDQPSATSLATTRSERIRSGLSLTGSCAHRGPIEVVEQVQITPNLGPIDWAIYPTKYPTSDSRK